jgi:hypothetical protein
MEKEILDLIEEGDGAVVRMCSAANDVPPDLVVSERRIKQSPELGGVRPVKQVMRLKKIVDVLKVKMFRKLWLKIQEIGFKNFNFQCFCSTVLV